MKTSTRSMQFSDAIAKVQQRQREIVLRFKRELAPFNNNEVACPWLLEKESQASSLACDVLVILQDWGPKNSCGSLASERAFLKSSWELSGNPTLKGLAQFGFEKPFREGKLVITNSVWGLRTSCDPCGYLGSIIHSAAFSAWLYLAATLAPSLIMLLGGWAVWSKADWGWHQGSGYLER